MADAARLYNNSYDRADYTLQLILKNKRQFPGTPQDGYRKTGKGRLTTSSEKGIREKVVPMGENKRREDPVSEISPVQRSHRMRGSF